MTSGNCLNYSLAVVLFITCINRDGEYFGAVPTNMHMIYICSHGIKIEPIFYNTNIFNTIRAISIVKLISYIFDTECHVTSNIICATWSTCGTSSEYIYKCDCGCLCMNYSRRMLAGALLFTGMAIFIFGLNIAEQLYPGYSVSQNYVSDLGATCRDGNCDIFQPSAMIFNSSVFLAGIFATIAAYLIRDEFNSPVFSLSFAFLGVGTMFVSVLPEYTGYLHILAAFIAFLFGGLSAITAFTILMPLFRYLSVFLGIMTLIALALLLSSQDLGLGPGGMERMVIYPVVLWALGFSGYLMHYDQENPNKTNRIDENF